MYFQPTATAHILAGPTPTPFPTTASQAATPVPTLLLPPTPTVFPNLVRRLSVEFVPPLPDGLAIDIYNMARNPFPDEGYEPVIRSSGEQSRLHALPQGRYYWDTADLAMMDADNAALAPFGYRLTSRPVGATTGARWFTLYRGGEVIADPIMDLGLVSVNRSGTDFLLLVNGTNHFQLVRKDLLESWSFINGTIASSRPQFLGDDIMYVETQEEAPATTSTTFEPSRATAEVFRNGQVIYTAHFKNRPAASGFIGFWTYGDHWALETVDQVVIDGQNVNTSNGYDKSYEFHLLDGRPLFFFEKSGTLSVSFDGMAVPLPFPSIPHYGCCSAGLDNPFQIGNLLIFYGTQGESWFFVEMVGK